MTAPKTPGALEDQAERLRMALAEAGYPSDARPDASTFSAAFEFGTPPIAVWARAADVVGIERRCLPCLEVAVYVDTPRVSPDCEGTGRCAS